MTIARVDDCFDQRFGNQRLGGNNLEQGRVRPNAHEVGISVKFHLSVHIHEEANIISTVFYYGISQFQQRETDEGSTDLTDNK
eukprot:11199005-Karenia_brevis.AAC.3